MGNTDPDRVRAEVPRQEVIGGAYCSYKVSASPPWIRLVITPEQLEFEARGPARLFARGPWVIPREQVKQVFAKRRTLNFPPLFWDVEIVTTDPSLWWTFWSPRRPEALLLSWRSAATRWTGLRTIGLDFPSSDAHSRLTPRGT
ncbi:hypothetical protein [Sinomonas gamaensis]|uniref:hypothetical protein n=1 Tax=Sinomonas gamaensis TaxID=2565624 RepID=UPI0011082FD6|nr:hypothetical protein [Sinomonas gamaensis]